MCLYRAVEPQSRKYQHLDRLSPVRCPSTNEHRKISVFPKCSLRIAIKSRVELLLGDISRLAVFTSARRFSFMIISIHFGRDLQVLGRVSIRHSMIQQEPQFSCLQNAFENSKPEPEMSRYLANPYQAMPISTR